MDFYNMGAKVVATVFIPIFAGFIAFVVCYVLALGCEICGYSLQTINPFNSNCEGFVQGVFWLATVVISFLGEMAIWGE